METDKDIEIGKVNDMIEEIHERESIEWNIKLIKKILKRLNRWINMKTITIQYDNKEYTTLSNLEDKNSEIILKSILKNKGLTQFTFLNKIFIINTNKIVSVIMEETKWLK